MRDIKETRVPIHCIRGRKRYKTVFTTGNKLMIEDHYPVIAEPGGKYISHVTPSDGTGRTLAKELVSVIQENNLKIKVLGMDGCSVNTGIHTGAMRIVEIEIGNVVQHVVCGLHLNELVFWHVFFL